MKLTKYERETIINYNEADREASVYTYNLSLLRQLEDLAMIRPDRVRRTSDNEYTIPKGWIKVITPRRLSRKQLKVISNMHEKRGISIRADNISEQT